MFALPSYTDNSLGTPLIVRPGLGTAGLKCSSPLLELRDKPRKTGRDKSTLKCMNRLIYMYSIYEPTLAHTVYYIVTFLFYISAEEKKNNSQNTLSWSSIL